MDKSIFNMSRCDRQLVEEDSEESQQMNPPNKAERDGYLEAEEGQEVWLTVDEVGNYLRVSRTTAYKMVKDGKIPSIRVGRLRRVSQRELNQALFDQGKV